MSRRQFWTVVTAVVALTAVLGVGAWYLFVWGPHTASEGLGKAASGKFGIGARMPDFSLKDVDGRVHRIRDARGGVVVLLSMDNRCPCSKAYIGRMNAIVEDYGPRGVEVWGFNPNLKDTEAATKAYAEKHGVRYISALDPGQKVADLLNAACTTEVWVVDRKGMLAYHGRIDDNIYKPDKVKQTDLRNALDAILDGKPAPVPETKAFACAIMRPGDQMGGASMPEGKAPGPMGR